MSYHSCYTISYFCHKLYHFVIQCLKLYLSLLLLLFMKCVCIYMLSGPLKLKYYICLSHHMSLLIVDEDLLFDSFHMWCLQGERAIDTKCKLACTKLKHFSPSISLWHTILCRHKIISISSNVIIYFVALNAFKIRFTFVIGSYLFHFNYIIYMFVSLWMGTCVCVCQLKWTETNLAAINSYKNAICYFSTPNWFAMNGSRQ